MTTSMENNLAPISNEEYMKCKNELQVRLMIDAGINDNNVLAKEWIDANSNRLNSIFTEEMAREYEKNPTDVVVMIKNKLYH